MQGDKQVLVDLNKILKNELTACNQYFLHACRFRPWGMKRIGKHEYDEAERSNGWRPISA